MEPDLSISDFQFSPRGSEELCADENSIAEDPLCFLSIKTGFDSSDEKVVAKYPECVTPDDALLLYCLDAEKPNLLESKPEAEVPDAELEPEIPNSDGGEPQTIRLGERSFVLDSNGRASYEIASGDNLWSIAGDVLLGSLGRQANASEIMAKINSIAQENSIANPSLIYAGQKLVISNEPVIDDAPSNLSPLGAGDDDAPSQGHSKPPLEDFYVDQRKDSPNPSEWYACGATSLQMALAANGLADRSESTRQRLIAETGTSRAVGLPGSAALLAQSLRGYGLESQYYSTNEISTLNEVLAAGESAIVNGSVVTRSGATVGHFIYVSERTPEGTYVVGDPANPGHTVWTAGELQSFMTRRGHPPGFASVRKT